MIRHPNPFKENQSCQKNQLQALTSAEFSIMCIIAPDNAILFQMRINHNIKGLKHALQELEKIKTQFNEAPVVLMESTAHYHRIIAQFFQNAGYEVIVINPIQSGILRNVNIRNVKNDKIDAHRIALLYRLKILHTSNQPNDVLTDIRELCRQRSELMSTHTSYTNRLIALLDQAFPGYVNFSVPLIVFLLWVH